VCLSLSVSSAFIEITSDLDIWRHGSSWRYLSEVRYVKVIYQTSRSQEENIAKVVGATSSEGFFLLFQLTNHSLRHGVVQRIFPRMHTWTEEVQNFRG